MKVLRKEDGGNAGGSNDMTVLYFIISFFSSVAGAISGIGGGIIIKPLMDATSGLEIATIGFLSGCTVLSMSIISLIRSRSGKVALDISCSTLLAIGGVVGGILGNYLFQTAKALLGADSILGLVQAALLLAITIGVFFYVRHKEHIHSRTVHHAVARLLIGVALGAVSSFLGIGGGPMNIAILYYFFSMDVKTSAITSLYIIFFSQLANLVTTIGSQTVPEVDYTVLAIMIAGAVTGALTGSYLLHRFHVKHVERFFSILLCVIMGINAYNLVRFALLIA